MARIIVADDHSLYRKGLKVALEAHFPVVEVLEAACLDEVVSAIEREADIDLALVDMKVPGPASFDELRAAREAHPQVRFAVISAFDGRENILNTLGAGLNGFISKSQPEHEIMTAITDILAGRIYVPPLLARVRTRPGNGVARETMPQPLDQVNVDLSKLTPRQRDVLYHMAQGSSNKEIARALDVAEATIKIHAAAVMRALGVRNRTEAAVVAKKHLEP